MNLQSDPILPDIAELEMVDGAPAAFLQVRSAMLQGQTGQAETAVRRTFPNGDAKEGFTVAPPALYRYHYTGVPGSEYTIALVLAEPGDREFSRPDDVLPLLNHTDFFHRLDLYVDEAGKDVPNLLAELRPEMMPTSDIRWPGLQISQHRSTFKLGAAGFCNPDLYALDGQATYFPHIHAFVNGMPQAANNACVDSLDSDRNSWSLEAAVRPDITVSQGMEAVWLGRDQGWAPGSPDSLLLQNVIWSFIGTGSSVVRFFPGVRLPKTFSPELRYVRSAHSNARPTHRLTHCFMPGRHTPPNHEPCS